MADPHIHQIKAALRAEARARRSGLGEAVRRQASEAAARNLLQAGVLLPGQVVAGYWPLRDELDVRSLLEMLVERGHPVCLPAVIGERKPLEMRLWSRGQALQPGAFGTLAPAGGSPVVTPDVVLVPLLGFDRFGARLGFGGGYYDRTLAKMPKPARLVGVAFSIQEFAAIPREPHDIALHAILTEQGFHSFSRQEAVA